MKNEEFSENNFQKYNDKTNAVLMGSTFFFFFKVEKKLFKNWGTKQALKFELSTFSMMIVL